MILIVYGVCLLLHVIVPARIVQGYCCNNEGIPLTYRLNGVLVYFIMIALFFAIPLDSQLALYENLWTNVYIVNILGLSASFYFLIKGGKEKYFRCVTVDQIKKSDDFKKSLTPAGPEPSLLTRFYLGSEWNPRIFNIDVKMFLYLVGAVGLQLNILSFIVAHQKLNNGNITNAMYVYVGLMGWFLTEYLIGEEVHLYTYDLFAEKIGFKLVWGCLVFYPFFYSISIAPIITTTNASDISQETSIIIVILFYIGWGLTRGANMQKFWSRRYPEEKTFLFGLIPQKTLPGTRILISGWWGLSRHINYLGEIIQALALALPGYLVAQTPYMKFLPFLYPIYYLLLFIPRQIDDDAVCKVKYGVVWDEYVKLVPYRICPGVW
jgi:Delta14-sterol reductase